MQSHGHFRNCTILANHQAGVWISDHSQPSFVHCKIYNGHQGGQFSLMFHLTQQCMLCSWMCSCLVYSLALHASSPRSLFAENKSACYFTIVNYFKIVPGYARARCWKSVTSAPNKLPILVSIMSKYSLADVQLESWNPNNVIFQSCSCACRKSTNPLYGCIL